MEMIERWWHIFFDMSGMRREIDMNSAATTDREDTGRHGKRGRQKETSGLTKELAEMSFGEDSEVNNPTGSTKLRMSGVQHPILEGEGAAFLVKGQRPIAHAT